MQRTARQRQLKTCDLHKTYDTHGYHSVAIDDASDVLLRPACLRKKAASQADLALLFASGHLFCGGGHLQCCSFGMQNTGQMHNVRHKQLLTCSLHM